MRKWRRERVVGNTGVVVGKMYNDAHDIWEDGEEAVVHFTDWVESANFYLAVTVSSCIKCPKDEERADAGNKSSGSP